MAIAKNELAGEKNVTFNFGLLGGCLVATEAALKIHNGRRRSIVRRGGKFDLPKVELGIAEGDTVNIAARMIPEFADEANFGFAAGFEKAKCEDFVRCEFVAGDDAGAVAAENECDGFFREDAAGSVRSEE
ncbi:MAG: hypothetical protein NVS9B14_01080 [Candidatus Acidiferrum sp.]